MLYITGYHIAPGSPGAEPESFPQGFYSLWAIKLHKNLHQLLHLHFLSNDSVFLQET